MPKAPLPPDILANCRRLRENATDAENLLWRLLRNRQLLGYKFRRQHSVNHFILDFYCHDKKLGIELDGGGHLEDTQLDYDQKRTEILRDHGIRILRYWNDQVLKEPEAVLQNIADEIEEGQ